MAPNITIPTNHPRYFSLMTREKLVAGFEKGLVAREGLIAHGRGESFDYLLGEKTIGPALRAINAASALFILAEYPVLSVNGNTAALCAKEICELNQSLEKSSIEINLFYRTKNREKLIANELKKYGLKKILGIEHNKLTEIPELASNRRKVDPNGIFKADVVFVPLEDGDRTIALKKMSKKIITVDLNPLSRTSITSDVSIVDNIVRSIPRLIHCIEHHKKNSTKKELKEIVSQFNNELVLKESLDILRSSKMLTKA
ncbi:MAG: phosphopantothenate/pantothenate synthetase [Thermoproteota archaeon]|nr:phosphopantothenate/pantothenate synthetase [Thermoproteota archaeon]